MALNRKWSDEQRDAIRELATLPGMTAAEITRRANAGDLTPGLAAFPIPFATVRDLATKARRKADVEGTSPGLDRAVLDASDEIAAMLAGAVRRAKRRAVAGRIAPSEIKELAAAAREVQRLARERPHAPQGTPKPGQGTDAPTDTIGALAAELPKTPRPPQKTYQQAPSEPLAGTQANDTTRNPNHDRPVFDARERISPVSIGDSGRLDA